MHHTSPPLCGSWKQRRGHLKHQAVGIPREQTEASRGLCGGQQFFSSPKKTRQLDLHSDFFDPLGRSVEQRNASPHPEQHAVVFRRKVHSHTGIGRPQRFVVFVGWGVFSPRSRTNVLSANSLGHPDPEAHAMLHTGTQAPSQRPADEKAEQGGRRIITSE